MSTTTATDRTWRRTATGLTVAAAGLTATTLALTPARHHLSLAGIVLLYLIPVLTTAATGGWPPAIAAAVTADLLVNYLFIPPFHTLAVETTDNLITLAVYVTVATAAGLTVDLAARHRATAAARTRQAQRLAGQAAELAHIDRTRAALLGAVGHDLRTPLAGIKAAASSLRQPDITFTTHDRAELLATIEESTDRLTALVDNLLSLSRLQAGALSVHLTPTALDAVVAQAVLTTDTHGTTIDIDVPDDLPLALADPGLLERVVANLLSNACTATPAGRPVHIHGHAHHDRLHLRIIDHGPGIAPADRDRVFAPFQRLNDHDPAGLGLGLAIARGFTEAQHATLTPDDTPDGGLTMTITLPAAPTRTTPR